MKKIAMSIIIVLLISILPLYIAFAAEGTVLSGSLNMRKEPATDSKVITVLTKGNKVEICNSTQNWYKVKYGRYTGYVYKDYIQTGSKKNTPKSTDDEIKGKANVPKACSPGDKGDNVKKIQKLLKNLGYYSGTIDGSYGKGTRAAVEAFQKNNGLTGNGIANNKTISKLTSSGARKASVKSNQGNTPKTETLYWFKGGSSKIPKGATFKVKDIRTGKVFTCKRWSGYNHLDAEPLTAKDTATMKKIFGGWSWNRRPILVKYNGHVYAASMNGMPHGTSTIKGNNFNGHFCIHFSGSKTHGSKKVDATHQNCVKTAAKYTW